jgi:preprotein translocase subunit SecG
MLNVILAVHIMACVLLIGLVLVQKSEGGGLGMGGSGGNSMFSARGAAGAIARTTMLVGGLFVLTSIALTYLANQRGDPRTDVQKALGVEAPATGKPDELFDPTAVLKDQGGAATPAVPVPAPGTAPNTQAGAPSTSGTATGTTTVTPPTPAPEAEPQPTTTPQ